MLDTFVRRRRKKLDLDTNVSHRERIVIFNSHIDVITMLAVLEHFPMSQYENLKLGCAQFLKARGLLLITVPSPRVDAILVALKFLRLIDAVSREEHHGFKVDLVTGIFSSEYFRPLKHKTFQLGLNHLFIFSRQETNAVTS